MPRVSGKTPAFSLCPQNNFRRHHVSLTKDSLLGLLRIHLAERGGPALPDKEWKGKVVPFEGILSLVFKQSAMNRAFTQKRGFGASIQTNGIELIFHMQPPGERAAQVEGQEKGLEKRMESAKREREGDARLTLNPQPEKRAKSVTTLTRAKVALDELVRVTDWLRGGDMIVART